MKGFQIMFVYESLKKNQEIKIINHENEKNNIKSIKLKESSVENINKNMKDRATDTNEMKTNKNQNNNILTNKNIKIKNTK